MLIEQIIEFELMEFGPPACMGICRKTNGSVSIPYSCTGNPKPGYFHDKKISE